MKFSELVDIDKLRELCESYTMINGAVTAILDLEGEILIATGWQDICTRFHRVNDTTAGRCRESDTILAGRLEKSDSYKIYKCRNGLVDVAVPIIIRGEHVANFFTGQFFTEAPDTAFFIRQAEEFCFDKDSYLEALNHVPIFSEDTIKSMMNFFTRLVGMIGEMGLARKELEEVNLELRNVITEREQAQKALWSEKIFLRSILDATTDLIYFKDCNSIYRECNKASEAFTGLSEQEQIGKSDFDLFDKEIADQIVKQDQKVLEGGVAVRTEEWVTSSTGCRLLMDTVKAPLYAQDGQPIGLVGISRDITERKQAEELLKSLTQRYQLALSSAHLGVWDWNIYENTMAWDDRMHELYGMTGETFSSNIDAWINGLHPEDKEAAIAECQAALKGEKEFDTVFRIIRPDGTVKHIKANGLVIRGTDGAAERMLGINFDISDLKHGEEEKLKLEYQLHQAQKMESVGRLAGGVAHDFNNMLSVILGHAELGTMRLDPNHPACADLMEISKTAKRSADLTRQLLAFARKQAVVPKVINLNEVVTGMFKLLQRLIGEDIHLAWQPAPNLWQVKIDPSQVDQIIANLCVNARDAIENTGRITIETENSPIDASYCAVHLDAVPGEYVRLSVSDDGCGMDKATVDHIFEPFFTTKEMGKGTGLGLATVYGVVKQNNGFINTYSEPGQGTTFSIYLPRHEGNNIKATAEGTSVSVLHGQETILLVEDETAILKITTMMLDKQGYNVLAASSSGEAINLAREHVGEIHLLMTDVIMPEMNGRDLTKKLLTIYPHMKLLYMSGYTADVIAHHGVLDESVHFIQKPFSLPNMAAKVREVLDEK